MSSTDVTDQELPRGAGSAGEEVVPRAAASTIVMRQGTFEILLLRRNDASTFVPGSWIFPGGTLETIDREPISRPGDVDVELSRMRICAARELLEEAGIWIGQPLGDFSTERTSLLAGESGTETLIEATPDALNELVLTSRWITPVGVPKRFDTFFFLFAVPDATVASPEHQEVVDAIWLTPDEALRKQEQGTLPMVFPTIKNIEAISSFASVTDLLNSRRAQRIPTTRPVLIVEGNRRRIILPEEGQ